MKPIHPRRQFFLVLHVSSVFLLVGCATTASLRPTSADGILGIPRYYPHARPVVFQAAQETARELGLRVTESAPDQSYFIARRGVTGIDWGTLVGVYFASVVDDSTLVVIRTEPKFAANLAKKDFTTVLHAGIRDKLEAQQGDATDSS